MITNIQRVSQKNPCPHCEKDHWCYFLGELSVCEREHPPAEGWWKTSKYDREGKYYYAPVEPHRKTIRPAQKRIWEYLDRDSNPLVRVIRIDDGKGGKPKRWQEHWNGQDWVKGLRGIKRENIPIYRYAEIQQAIADKKIIFVVEGEPCADALWKLDIPATTNLGGSGKWRQSDTKDLTSAKKIVLCPDRDNPGVKHMENIAADFKDIQWLYAYPNSSLWNKLPQSKGLDVADWIEDYRLTAKQVSYHIGEKRNTIEKEISQESSFLQICAQIDKINALPCPGDKKWRLYKLAKENKVSVPQMMTAYNAALINQPIFKGVGIKDLLAKTPERFDWLVAAVDANGIYSITLCRSRNGKNFVD